MNIINYLNKELCIKLRDGKKYYGHIDYIDNESILDDCLITLVNDDYKYVSIWLSEIATITEVKKDGTWKKS